MTSRTITSRCFNNYTVDSKEFRFVRRFEGTDGTEVFRVVRQIRWSVGRNSSASLDNISLSMIPKSSDSVAEWVRPSAYRCVLSGYGRRLTDMY